MASPPRSVHGKLVQRPPKFGFLPRAALCARRRWPCNRRTGCDPFAVVGVIGPKATEHRFVREMLLALDLDSSPGTVVFSVINTNADTFDVAAYAAGRNDTQSPLGDASSTPGALGAA